ncbi:uncharacterized protein LOC18029500 [Eutrema salsugineum]|uniref:uncharacterized protein LOC18029500 n=1 Tax=Eutrema salsugineum TaxID=72664 RepID=UPI000CED02A3|nr:uncharacterized protein LOC18029500 [Eutrema salsugineum]
MEGRGLKACSSSTASTDVEAADLEGTKPLQEAERELQKSEEKSEEIPTTKPKRKKQKMTPEIKEMKNLRESFKEMTETVKKLQETLLVQAGLPVISFKEKGTTPVEKNEEKYECCFESKESDVMHSKDHTIFVKGFDPSQARDDIKTALRAHFGTCGKVTRVFVPTQCKTGATLGYVFVDLQSGADKALKLAGSLLGGWSLEVMMAKDISDIFYGLSNLKGCPRCSVILRQRMHKRFITTHGGRCLTPHFKFPLKKKIKEP